MSDDNTHGIALPGLASALATCGRILYEVLQQPASDLCPDVLMIFLTSALLLPVVCSPVVLTVYPLRGTRDNGESCKPGCITTCSGVQLPHLNATIR